MNFIARAVARDATVIDRTPRKRSRPTFDVIAMAVVGFFLIAMAAFAALRITP